MTSGNGNTAPVNDPFASGPMFAIMRDVEKAVGAQERLLQSISDGALRDRAEIADHEARIRLLESRMWLAMGASSAFAAGLTALVTKLIGA